MKKTLYIVTIVVVSGTMIGVLLASREVPRKKPDFTTKTTVSVIQPNNESIRISLPIIGRLVAKNEMIVYAEVGGILENAGKPFLEGVKFSKGEPLLVINNETAELSLKALRSNLLMQITQMLPEMKFDYPESYAAWENYLNQFDINSEVAPLPEPQTNREKLYVAGRGIFSAYYETKGQEVQLKKYTIYTPFDGTVTASNIKPGTLVRSGQSLGEFISSGEYDLITEITLDEVAYLKIGDAVELHNNSGQTWVGTVSRIGDNVSQTTQMADIYIAVNGSDLREGQYLEGTIKTATEVMAMEIPRKVITNNNTVLSVVDGVIVEQPIDILLFTDGQALVNGLNDGIVISTKTQNVYNGLQVITQ